MKKLTYILLTLLVLAACTGTSRNPQLVAVDSLLLSRPDSALTLLRSMSFSSTSDRMYYYMLLADACNKCYDTLPSDSILQEVAEYYDRHGNSNEQVRAHYLLGCAYRDLGEAPMALQCYQDAVDFADTTASDCNYRLLMSVYGQMAELFHLQNLPLDEIDALELSGKYSLLNRDTIHYLRSLELTSKAYDLLGDTAHLIDIIEKTNFLYRKHNNPQMAYSGNATLAYISIKRGDLKTAKKLLHEFENYSGLFNDKGDIAPDRTLYYYVKGFYYYHINQLDSAESFMRKLLARGDEADAYRGLLTIYQQKKNTDSIIKYARLYEDAVDTLNNMKRTEVVGQMQAMYNYTRHQEAARRAEQKAERTRTLLLVLLAAGLIVVAAGTMVYLQYRNRKRAEIQQLTNDYGRALMEYNKQSAELERLKQEDSSLIEEKQLEVEELKEKLLYYQSSLQVSDANRQVSAFTESDIVSVFREKAKGSPRTMLPTEAEWKRLVSQFSQSVPLAFSAMGRNVILSANEMRVCVLLLSGFKIADIAILLDCSPQSVTNIKARANNKLFAENSATTLEKNLMKTIGLPKNKKFIFDTIIV